MHYNEVKGTEDEPILWFALALIQWKKGRLLDEVKEKALYFIENGSDLSRWNVPGNEKNHRKSIKVLDDLKATLLSPMPEAKEIRKRKPYWIWTSPWRKVALLCYKIIDKRAINEYIGKFILVRVVSIVRSKSSGYTTENLRLGLYG